MEENDDTARESSLAATGSDDAQSEFSVAPSEYSTESLYSATSSRFSIAPTEFTVAPSETGTVTETEGRGYSRSVAGSDATVNSAAPKRIRSGQIRVPHRRRGDPTLYDCVAGNVRRKAAGRGLYRHQLYTRPYSAAEYYFGKLRAKTGDEDEDARLYWHRELDHHNPPQSDVLWAVHRYASHFFGKDGAASLKFMDESALLALGVLLEETMKEELGETGYLAFLEPGEDGSTDESMSTSEAEPDEDDEAMGSKRRSHPAPSDNALKKRKNGEPEAKIKQEFNRDDFLTDDEDESP